METINMNIELSYGVQTFKNVIPVSDDFDFRTLAKNNGLELKKYEPKNEAKYGGMGFVTYRTPENTYFQDAKELTIGFLNERPVFIAIRGIIK